jgi:restriction endonuclease Mrr
MSVDVEIPTYGDLMWPTLGALEELGGSGTKDEIDESVISAGQFTEEQLEVTFAPEATQTGSKIVHRLAWARTYLKKIGAATNSSRGVWAITPMGREILTEGEANGRKTLQEGDREVRRLARQRKLATTTGSDTDSEDPDSPPGDEADDWKAELLQLLIGLRPDEFERASSSRVRIREGRGTWTLRRRRTRRYRNPRGRDDLLSSLLAMQEVRRHGQPERYPGLQRGDGRTRRQGSVHHHQQLHGWSTR